MSAPGEKSETQVVRGEITESERRSYIYSFVRIGWNLACPNLQ